MAEAFNTKLSATQIIDSIQKLLVLYELSTSGSRDDFMCGKCDAFALGLAQALSNYSVDCTLTRISRITTYFHEPDADEASTELETDFTEVNDLCHVYLECMGQEIDVGGLDASERYVDHWFDEPYSQTDFSYHTTHEVELLAIRASKGEALDHDVRQFVAQNMGILLASLAAGHMQGVMDQSMTGNY